MTYERHKHTLGLTRSATHYAWTNMIQRCTNSKRPDFKFYGGRGIKVCPQWRNSFSAFLADVGERPTSDYSLDRFPNQDGNYEPGNVRWATKDQQMQNTRATRLLSFGGKTMGLTAWARYLGLARGSIQVRLANGWSIQRALTESKRGTNGN